MRSLKPAYWLAPLAVTLVVTFVPRLCKCIQVAADATLDRREQSLAASFFADPHQAQVVRQSKDQRDGVFWERYKDFSALAEAFCKS